MPPVDAAILASIGMPVSVALMMPDERGVVGVQRCYGLLGVCLDRNDVVTDIALEIDGSVALYPVSVVLSLDPD